MTSPYEDDEPLLPDQTRDDDARTWGENDTSDDDERILRDVAIYVVIAGDHKNSSGADADSGSHLVQESLRQNVLFRVS